MSEHTFDWSQTITALLRAQRHVKELHGSVKKTVYQFKSRRSVTVHGTQPTLVAGADIVRFVF
jgi:hypothetical protein